MAVRGADAHISTQMNRAGECKTHKWKRICWRKRGLKQSRLRLGRLPVSADTHQDQVVSMSFIEAAAAAAAEAAGAAAAVFAHVCARDEFLFKKDDSCNTEGVEPA